MKGLRYLQEVFVYIVELAYHIIWNTARIHFIKSKKFYAGKTDIAYKFCLI